MSQPTGSVRFKWQAAGLVALALWVGYRTWDYYGRPLTEADLKTASPDRLALGLSNPDLRDRVAAKLLDSGPGGWKALVRALRSPNRDARLVAAQSLATLRVVDLEAGIRASLVDADPQVLDAKFHALATNGSRAVLPDLRTFLGPDSPATKTRGTNSVAVSAFAVLAASVGDKASIEVLEHQAKPLAESTALAIADIDPEEAERFGRANWKQLSPGAKIRIALRLPQLAGTVDDPNIRAFAMARHGVADAAGELKPTEDPALYAAFLTASWNPLDASRPSALVQVAAHDPGVAAISSFVYPDLSVAQALSASAVTTPWFDTTSQTCIKIINGDTSVTIPEPTQSVPYVLAASVRREQSAKPLLRKMLSPSNRALGNANLAAMALARISSEREDFDLVYRHLLERKPKWTGWDVEAAVSFPDGRLLLKQVIDQLDVTNPEGQEFVMLLGQLPGMRQEVDFQRQVVAKCADMPWEAISKLEPTWCRQFGDDVLKEKYAVLLGNHRYLGRIRDLVAMARSGHPKTLEELKDTAGRGMIDEIITGIELAGEEPVNGDRLSFVLQYCQDKRWRVREAVAYALRRMGT
ncbi:MAG: hypothetical protein JSS65_07160, partial [Armatimonadetes bacterium]|nr:hypothetical protein [Armatimonadota bacterium]